MPVKTSAENPESSNHHSASSLPTAPHYSPSVSSSHRAGIVRISNPALPTETRPGGSDLRLRERQTFIDRLAENLARGQVTLNRVNRSLDREANNRLRQSFDSPRLTTVIRCTKTNLSLTVQRSYVTSYCRGPRNNFQGVSNWEFLTSLVPLQQGLRIGAESFQYYFENSILEHSQLIAKVKNYYQ